MEAVNSEEGLIRYKSEEQIQTGGPFVFSTRGKAFTVVLVLLIGIMATLLVTRTSLEATILRTPGMRYQTNEDGSISNVYNYKVINKSNGDMVINFVPMDSTIQLKLVGAMPEMAKQGVAEGAFFLSVPATQIEFGKAHADLGIYDQEGKLLETVEISVMGPL